MSKIVVTEKFAEAFKKVHGFIPDYFLVTPNQIKLDNVDVKEVEERLNNESKTQRPVTF
jgi:hypothetical protein